MASNDLLMSTLKPSRAALDAELSCPALTIAYHPDFSRIGETRKLPELLEGRAVALSRLEPHFGSPAGGAERPLANPFLSRKPLRLEPARDGIRISLEKGATGLSIEGARCEAAIELSGEAVQRGVLLDLAGRVLLLLHQAPPRIARTSALGMLGEAPEIQRLRMEILDVAPLDVPVLILGETGTGKELVAQAIAEDSKRARAPFVAVNMAAIPGSTAASQLFGHAAGAFTGATRDHKGFFEQAHGGTLFLDEIGETPLESQAMLLRVLETRELQPLGAQRSRPVDVRVIAATDADLDAAIIEKGFREALLHRLAGYQLTLPPLRERREDIGRLAAHFLAAQLEALGCARLLEASKTPWLGAAIFSALVRHDWPGNVRELRNVVRQLAIAYRSKPEVRLEGALRLRLERPAAPMGRPSVEPPRKAPAAISEDELLEALRSHSWRTAATAAALGISRTSLYALIDRSDRLRKAKDIPVDELKQLHQACGGDLDAMSEQLEVSRRGLQLRLRETGLG